MSPGRSSAPPAPQDPQDSTSRLRAVLELAAAVAESAREVEPAGVVRSLVQQCCLQAQLDLTPQGPLPAASHQAQRPGTRRTTREPDLRLPLRAGELSFGALQLWTARDEPLTDELRLALRTVAGAVSARLEHQRLQALAEEQRVTAEQLLATVSHELSSPVAAVLFNVELCVTRVAQSADEVPREWLETRLKRTREAVSSVRNLVNGILGVAQLRGGRLALNLQPVDLSRVTQAILARMSDELEWAGCEVRTELPPSLVGTWDALKLEIVVSNLISNAMKFGAEKPIDIRVHGDDTRAQLSVTDRGPGIRAEQRARMFQQFSRDTTTKVAGSGLGLWIAHSYVQAHGGSIDLEVAEGQGTTFTVTLPRVTVSR